VPIADRLIEAPACLGDDFETADYGIDGAHIRREPCFVETGDERPGKPRVL
jgi:hypothetical protein